MTNKDLQYNAEDITDQQLAELEKRGFYLYSKATDNERELLDQIGLGKGLSFRPKTGDILAFDKKENKLGKQVKLAGDKVARSCYLRCDWWHKAGEQMTKSAKLFPISYLRRISDDVREALAKYPTAVNNVALDQTVSDNDVIALLDHNVFEVRTALSKRAHVDWDVDKERYVASGNKDDVYHIFLIPREDE